MSEDDWRRAADVYGRRAQQEAAQAAQRAAEEAARAAAAEASRREYQRIIRAQEEELEHVAAKLQTFLDSEAGRNGLRLIDGATNGWGILFGRDGDDYEPGSVYLLGDGFYSFGFTSSLTPESKHRTTAVEAVRYFKQYHEDRDQWRSVVKWLKGQLDRLARETLGGR